MDSQRIDETLRSIAQHEQAATDSHSRVAIGELYDRLAEAAPQHGGALMARNRFRLRHPECVPQDRPKVLIGGMNEGCFPNFHSTPLLRVADVVSLTTRPNEGRIERVSYDFFGDRFVEILERLPEGFVPDLFFDNQVMGAHLIPAGLEQSPFPTVGGLTHLSRGSRTPRAAELFDVLLPLSRTFVPGLERLTGKVVLDLPFGLNWGSLHDIIRPAATKDIDLSCTLGPALTLAGHSPTRHRIHAFMESFASRHRDRYRIEVTSGLSKAAYFDVLSRSRISLNTTNFHGPYNYRTCEIMNAGGLCIHVNDPGYFAVQTDLGEYFEDGREVVLSSLERLEETLLEWLDKPEETRSVAEAGRQRLESEYSYERLYERLFEEVAALEIDPARRPSAARAYFALGAQYWNGGRDDQLLLASQALAGLSEQSEPVQLNNLMVVAARLIEQSGLDAIRPLFASIPGIADVFEAGLDTGIRAIQNLVPDDPIVAWNAMILKAELGTLAQAEVLETESLLEAGIAAGAFDDALLVKPRLPYLVEPEEGQIYFGLFQHRLVAAYGDPQAAHRVHLDYMRWHVLRWLHATGDPTRADVLVELLELWPANSVLQLEWVRREGNEPARAPEFRDAYREILRLDPTCAEAREALQLEESDKRDQSDRAVPEQSAARSVGSSSANASRANFTSSP